MKQVCTFLLGAGVLFIMSCTSPTSESKEAHAGEADTLSGETLSTDSAAEVTDSASVVEAGSAADWFKKDMIVANCDGNQQDVAIPVIKIAEKIQSENIDYDVTPFSDCSGIFHRFLDSMTVHCAGHTHPNPEQYRDSRAIAKWYHEEGVFTRILKAAEMGEYLKPGAVMFYGPRESSTADHPLEDLFATGGINHVGVVTAITTDENGTVTGYSLFHGRRPGKTAGITNYHKLDTGREEYPPYGNGTEEWVGVAPVVY